MSRNLILIFLAVLVGIVMWLLQTQHSIDVADSTEGVAQETQTSTQSPANAQATVSVSTAADQPEQPCDPNKPVSLTELKNGAEIEVDLQEFERRKRALVTKLVASPAAEHLYVAALLEEDLPTRLQLIKRALSIVPDSAVTLWTAVQTCAAVKEQAYCPLDDWTRRLLLIDSDNSEVWMLVAAIRHRAGATGAALKALRQAATAAETRVYWPEIVALAEQSIAAAGDYPFAERANMAFGTAASSGPNYQHFVDMCDEQSAQDAEWASLCLAYGERAERQYKTLLGAAIARAIQSIALEAMGEMEQLAVVNARRQAFKEQRQDQAEDMLGISLLSPTLFNMYLTALRIAGEAGANDILAEEARRMLGQLHVADCD